MPSYTREKNHASSPPQAEIFWIWELQILKKKSACGYFFKISTCFFTCVISFPPPTNSCKSPSNKKTLPLARRKRKILRVLRRFGTIFQRNLTFQSTKPSKILPAALFCFLICLRFFYFRFFFVFGFLFFSSYTPARPGKKNLRPNERWADGFRW